MSFANERVESKELKTMRSLNTRMNLSEDDAYYYRTLEKGFEGEKIFDTRLVSLPEEWLALNDLLFKVNRTPVQLDSILIRQRIAYLFEIKNFEGDYFLQGDRWLSKTGREVKNPLLQLQRATTLLRQLFQELGISLKIEPYLVFVNPEFHLYHAPSDHPIVFPTQLNRFFNKLKASQSKLNSSHKRISDKLLSRHLDENPFSQIPDYNYGQLKKGMTCALCHSFITACSGNQLTCHKCGHIETLESAIIRHVAEHQLLFPDEKVTVSAIQEWCGVVESKKTMRRILSSNYHLQWHGRHSYYSPIVIK